MSAAFQALLRGDLAERDRLCALAENAISMANRVQNGGPVALGEAIEIEPVPILLPDLSGERMH